MGVNKFFKILETQSSVINYLPCRRYLMYTPGYFFVFLMFSVFLLSAVLDISLIILIFLVDNKYFVGMIFSIIALGPIIFTTIFNFSHVFLFKKENSQPINWYNYVFCLFTYFGLCTMNTRITSIRNIFIEPVEKCRIKFPLFYVHDEIIATLKIYCFFFTISKSIPQMFAIPTYFVTYEVNMWTALVARTSILHNMVLFSLTMATLFPVRKKPKYFESFAVALLNALSKFFGAMCACGLRIIVYTETYKTIGLKALLVQLLRMALSLYPSLNIIYKVCPNHSYFFIIMYAPLIGIVLSFLYIHPFSLKGSLHYYFFYLISTLIDIFSIYILSEGDNECIITLISLIAILVACIGCFGLTNSFNRKICRMVCLPTGLISREFSEDEEEIKNFYFQETK